MTPSRPSRHLPLLPLETKAHILTFCDAPTLAQASLVSLTFLELASPRLYGHITITGFDQLDRLFYKEVSELSRACCSVCGC